METRVRGELDQGAAYESRKTLESVPLHAMLDQARQSYGDRPALDFLGKKWTWAQVADLSDRMAQGLQSMGIQKGDRVGLFLPNTPYYLIAYFAISRIGGIIVNYNPLYAERELAHQIEDSGTRFVITLDLTILCEKLDKMLHTTCLEKIVLCTFTDILPFPKNILFRLFRGDEIARNFHDDRTVRFSDITDNEGEPRPVPVDPDRDVALLQYTGGTTGIPKGAMLTHRNIVSNAVQCETWFADAKPGAERMLGVLPFFHVFAMTAVMNLSVRKGLEIIALPKFDLTEMLRAIASKKPHYFPAVPAIFNAINNHPDLARYDLSSLRYGVSGGASLPQEIRKAFEKKTGCPIVEGYGLTEASPVVCVNPVGAANRPGSIGLPLPYTDLRLVSITDGRTPVAQGERGELCVRGPQVMAGYWNRPDETARVLIDGWLHTGDIATMDADGYVFIVDRLKDMVITNGYNVYPRNVEEAIYMHPGIEECIVAGLPDPARGEIVKVWIKLKAGRKMTAEDLREFLMDKLSPIEIPRVVEFRDKPLPRTLIGKLSRKDVLAQEKETG
ncbi:MAG: long-chain fatty acid--CoA ligase [Rhodospirillales bacterium]|nr:long-chain fatty acid--CoA ligase [Rhodospirillales bacterium]